MHDPRDEEVLARLLCEAQGFDPSEPERGPHWNWENYIYQARRLRDALQDKGWKITDRNAMDTQEKYQDPDGDLVHLHDIARDQWTAMHDAAPIVPRSEA